MTIEQWCPILDKTQKTLYAGGIEDMVNWSL